MVYQWGCLLRVQSNTTIFPMNISFLMILTEFEWHKNQNHLSEGLGFPKPPEKSHVSLRLTPGEQGIIYLADDFGLCSERYKIGSPLCLGLTDTPETRKKPERLEPQELVIWVDVSPFPFGSLFRFRAVSFRPWIYIPWMCFFFVVIFWLL